MAGFPSYGLNTPDPEDSLKTLREKGIIFAGTPPMVGDQLGAVQNLLQSMGDTALRKQYEDSIAGTPTLEQVEKARQKALAYYDSPADSLGDCEKQILLAERDVDLCSHHVAVWEDGIAQLKKDLHVAMSMREQWLLLRKSASEKHSIKKQQAIEAVEKMGTDKSDDSEKKLLQEKSTALQISQPASENLIEELIRKRSADFALSDQLVTSIQDMPDGPKNLDGEPLSGISKRSKH